MATARHWLNLPYGHNGDTHRVCEMPFGMFKYCPSSKAKTLHVLLPVFCIAYSQSVPIFEEVSSPSG
jgi:hypothetical protein